MRGDPRYAVATAVDREGNKAYHILPTRWATITIVILVIVFLIAAVLGLLIISNKYDIENLKREIDVERSNANAHTPNANR